MKLRHIIGSTAIGDLPGNGAGNITGPCRYGSDRLAGEGSPVAGCHAAKSPGDKADASACSHRRTALYHSIAHMGIRLKAACKPCEKPAACRSASCSRCAACPAEYAACCPRTAGRYAGYHTGRHEQFHAHAAACLGHIQTHSRQIGVELLRRFQKCEGHKHPEEYAALAGGKGAAAAHKLSHRRVERPEEPYV